MTLRLRPAFATALFLAVVPFQPAKASSTMTNPPEITADMLTGQTLDQLSQTYGKPEVIVFTLDEDISEFRIPLLNKFDKAVIVAREVELTEATFSLDEDNNLTVWLRGDDYVDHYVYDKLTDF